MAPAALQASVHRCHTHCHVVLTARHSPIPQGQPSGGSQCQDWSGHMRRGAEGRLLPTPAFREVRPAQFAQGTATAGSGPCSTTQTGRPLSEPQHRHLSGRPADGTWHSVSWRRSETFAKSPAWGLALSKRKPTFLRPFARGGLGSWSTGGVVWGGWRPGQAWSCLGGCDWGAQGGRQSPACLLRPGLLMRGSRMLLECN